MASNNNLSLGNVLSFGGPSCLGLNLQGPVVSRQELTLGLNHDLGKNPESDEEGNSFSEEGIMDGHCGSCKVNRVHWPRVKWVDSMVKLLITAVSYLGEDALVESDGFGGKKILSLHKKEKWKLVSKVLAERGCLVSPQQCEDKFNDLNKRFKKLNDILGRGTACQVVEKPGLLDMMDRLTEKKKDDVRKILNSKHLFYEEMCSYHNNNRLHLPHDPDLQRSLHSLLKSTDDVDFCCEMHRHDNDFEADVHEGYDETYGRVSSKRVRLGRGLDEFNFVNPNSVQDVRIGLQLHPENPQTDMNLGFPDGRRGSFSEQQWLKAWSLELEERRLKIEAGALELEKQRFKWQRFCKKKDHQLEMWKIENKKMKLKNERAALELKRREMTINCNR
ncbi:uncharacterized protein LOC141594614 [Silene latifolia]|uniref:uncharacterized protein LOC141594614 n=1 Tax=Silene latifolia TaxID=37657 RepID=UPI003D77CAE3